MLELNRVPIGYVVEPADTYASGAYELSLVEVRILSYPQNKETNAEHLATMFYEVGEGSKPDLDIL